MKHVVLTALLLSSLLVVGLQSAVAGAEQSRNREVACDYADNAPPFCPDGE